MKESIIAGAIVIAVFVVMISALVFTVNSIKSYKCSSTAKVLGVESEYSWSTGCILIKQDGTKTPLYLQRFMN